MTGRIIPVILSGGAGTRLWPMSSAERPKQFLALAGAGQGASSLFADTLARVADAARFAPPVIVGNAAHRALIAADLGALAASATQIFEPLPRNTAPAIALAALAVAGAHGGDALMLVMPSDHIIADTAALLTAVDTARAAAVAGWLVTFGVTPDAPETGYGYLACAEEISAAPGARRVARFVEKPPLADAAAMVADGQHLWNAGIFLMRADAVLAELDAQCPAISTAARQALADGVREGAVILPDSAAFAASPAVSIDYAVMERAARVAAVPMAPGWSDVGSWDAIAQLGAADADGNRLSGPVTSLDASDCLIRSDGLEIAVLGVSNLIVIASDGKLLIMPRGRSQEVKRLLAERE